MKCSVSSNYGSFMLGGAQDGGGCDSLQEQFPQPFRLSSTGKGEPVKPGVYYFIEDVVAVNANAGRPYREALAARYDASPRFRQMMYNQSLFWSIPALIIAIPLTVIAVVHSIPATVAYGICWAVPFLWATIWAFISVQWVRSDMRRERREWKSHKGFVVPVIEEDQKCQPHHIEA